MSNERLATVINMEEVTLRVTNENLKEQTHRGKLKEVPETDRLHST